MKTSHVVLAIALLASSRVAAQQQVSISRATVQVAAGTVAIPIGFRAGVGVGAIASGGPFAGQPFGILGGIVGGATGAVAGPAIAVRTVGTGGAPHGSGMAAAGGAIAGYAADLFIDKLVVPKIPHSSTNDVLSKSIVVANFVIPALCATLAYDRSRR